MDLEVLKNRLKEIETISNQQWLDSLSARKKKELEFHDTNRDIARMKALAGDAYEKHYGNKKYYKATGLLKTYIDSWILKNVKDKIFLDYACGNGELAIKAAKYGCKLAIGLDISRVSIENAKQESTKKGVGQMTYFIQADAENTMLPDDSIDVIICSGMLHHLDLSYAFPELRRILSPGGKVFAVEALGYNPAIKLYRYITPQMRTDWEKTHILSLKDIRFARRFFNIGEIKYWHITSIFTPYMKFMLPFFNWVDHILTKMPVIKLMAWIFTFELIKKKDEDRREL